MNRLFEMRIRDDNSYYTSGSSSHWSGAAQREAEGAARGREFHEGVQSGAIELADDETIKIVSHSQGGAYAHGLANQLLTYKDADGNQYLLGSAKLAKPYTKNLSHDVYLICNDKILATIDLEDAIKPDVQKALVAIEREGVQNILLSGDQKSKVKTLANDLGITTFYGEQLPDQKLAHIAKLSAAGLTAMVGDGINDAPALAKADIGISLSDASSAAVQSAEIVLLDGKISHLPKALAISKHTLLTIKQNLFWAFAYNIVAIPIAAMGFLNPMLGALFMAFSDVIVIGNSIRLEYKRIGKK